MWLDSRRDLIADSSKFGVRVQPFNLKIGMLGDQVFFSLSVFLCSASNNSVYPTAEFIVGKSQRIIGDERLPGCKYPTTHQPFSRTHSLFLFASLS